MWSTCVIVVVFIIIILFLLLLTSLPTKSSEFRGGGLGGAKGSTGPKKRKHFYENIWDDYCLDDNPDLDDLLDLYERKKIGKKLRYFLEWYKPSYSSKCIYEYLTKQKGFDEYDVRLQVYGDYIDLTGKRTNNRSLSAPHIIFIHPDHSCIRLKPIVGGKIDSYTPWPTISFSIVYNTETTDFSNEAFKITRDGEPIPKAGLNYPDACLNPDLSRKRVDTLMKSTHLKLPKPSVSDIRFFRNIELTE